MGMGITTELGMRGRIDDGPMIELDSYCVGDTYSGIYEGADQVDCVAMARADLDRFWGKERPVLVEEPERGKDEPFPRRRMMAWLVTNEAPAATPDDHGSHLFVVWWAERDPDNPLMAALEIVHRRGGWEKLSRGFCL
jgi:hypothetical protein